MILLETNDYSKLNALLDKAEINILFARAVAEQKINGRIYVDNADTPRTCYILHPYGMSLLLGDSNNVTFNQEFREYVLNINGERTNEEWMQTYPNAWDNVLKNLFVDVTAIEYDTRINFRYNKDKRQREEKCSIRNIQIRETTKEDFEDMKDMVIPARFWDNADDFIINGKGYSLYYEQKLASIAFASFIKNNILEFGIETVEQYRGRNLAFKVCIALIDYCLENNLEPLWSCKLSNMGSYKLAEKLGFEIAKENPYYRLKIM